MIGPLWTSKKVKCENKTDKQTKQNKKKKLFMQEFYYACTNLYM